MIEIVIYVGEQLAQFLRFRASGVDSDGAVKVLTVRRSVERSLSAIGTPGTEFEARCFPPDIICREG